MRGFRRGSGIVIATMALALLAPSPAAAGTVYIPDDGPSNSVHYFDAVAVPSGLLPNVQLNQNNNVTAWLTADRRNATILDPGQVFLPGGYQTEITNTIVQCGVMLPGRANCTSPPEGRPYSDISVSLGGGNDSLSIIGDTWGSAYGGDGADVLDASSAGSSAMTGGRGNDHLIGGPGRDNFDSGIDAGIATTQGDDLFELGAGRDKVNAYTDGDRVFARDGEVDQIWCAGSAASVLADPVDELRDCPNADVG